jgi:glucose/arabinose dehydrogenase
VRRLAAALLALGSAAEAARDGAGPLDQISLPPGFTIELLSDQVPGARAMAFGERGTLFVGSKTGRVYALDYAAVAPLAPRVIAERLHRPHGVAFRDGALYVAEIPRLLRFDGIEARLDRPPAPVVLIDDLPRHEHHGMRPIRFAPDGSLYMGIGVPCNICLPEPGFAAIHRVELDRSPPRRTPVAEGVRNSVGFDFHPASGALWFTDNGRDWLGNDEPADELNHAPREGLHFGFPHCHGGDLVDPKFGLEDGCARFTPPAMQLGPHVAALGMRFYTGDAFPPAYRGAIFIAEHGSWNREEKIGYRISVVQLDGEGALSYRPFAEGWLQGDAVSGRPVDVELAPDGALLVSDDQRGAVYRIRYVGSELSDR